MTWPLHTAVCDNSWKRGQTEIQIFLTMHTFHKFSSQINPYSPNINKK